MKRRCRTAHARCLHLGNDVVDDIAVGLDFVAGEEAAEEDVAVTPELVGQVRVHLVHAAKFRQILSAVPPGERNTVVRG